MDAAFLDRARDFLELRMESRCIVRRRSGRRPQEEASGKASPEWIAVHTDLPMRLDFSTSGEGASTTVTLDGIEYELATGVGHFPALTEDLADGDFVEITAGENAGMVWSIVKAVRADQKTARRVPIREESRPVEWGF